MFRGVALERGSTGTVGGVWHSWSVDLVGEGRLRQRAEKEEEVGLLKGSDSGSDQQ